MHGDWIIVSTLHSSEDIAILQKTRPTRAHPGYRHVDYGWRWCVICRRWRTDGQTDIRVRPDGDDERRKLATTIKRRINALSWTCRLDACIQPANYRLLLGALLSFFGLRSSPVAPVPCERPTDTSPSSRRRIEPTTNAALFANISPECRSVVVVAAPLCQQNNHNADCVAVAGTRSFITPLVKFVTAFAICVYHNWSSRTSVAVIWCEAAQNWKKMTRNNLTSCIYCNVLFFI